MVYYAQRGEREWKYKGYGKVVGNGYTAYPRIEITAMKAKVKYFIMRSPGSRCAEPEMRGGDATCSPALNP